MGCSCLHNKSFPDKDRFFSLIKVVSEEISSEKFTLETVEQSAITIATKNRDISPITIAGGK